MVEFIIGDTKMNVSINGNSSGELFLEDTLTPQFTHQRNHFDKQIFGFVRIYINIE